MQFTVSTPQTEQNIPDMLGVTGVHRLPQLLWCRNMGWGAGPRYSDDVHQHGPQTPPTQTMTGVNNRNIYPPDDKQWSMWEPRTRECVFLLCVFARVFVYYLCVCLQFNTCNNGNLKFTPKPQSFLLKDVFRGVWTHSLCLLGATEENCHFGQLPKVGRVV